MNRDDLKDLAANPDFISGIYNYCDRWCERCAFSSRCFVYATENVDPGDDDVKDLTSAKFWRELELIFKDAHELIAECAKEAGVDLETLEENEPGEIEDPEDTAGNEFAILARNYANMVQDWFANEFPSEHGLQIVMDAKSCAAEAEIDLPDALEVIRWYQFFIAAKVFRALLGSDPEISDIYGDDVAQGNPAQTDANGSAKVALIAIERSFNAWRIVAGYIPDKTASISPLLTTLENLRVGIGDALPLARDFVRPGFDDVISEFAN